MAENHSKSKLKRKKPSVEDFQPETSGRTAPKRSHSDGTAEPGRSVWWDRERLPAVEALWALTLRSALPYLEKQHWDLVPDLPHPSAVRPTALRDGQRLCDSKKVAPFPETSPPSPRTSPSPDALRLSSSQQGPPGQTKPVPHPPDGQPSSHSRHSPEAQTASLTTRPRPPVPCQEGPLSSTGPSGVGREEGKEEGRRGGEQEGQTGPVTHQVWACDGRVSLQEEGDNEEEEEVQRSVGGGGRLQSCPMCLLVFPVGFTQMDCDGHLAQCLSEVNVDVTW